VKVLRVLAFLVLAVALPSAGGTRAVPAAATPTVVERPPQFIMMSFDGDGIVDLWQYWRAVARESHAHFTFFLSGVYFLEPEHALEYLPPDRSPGKSEIGFLPVPKGQKSEPILRALLAEFDAARTEGHELGTHFNGHFCGTYGATVWDSEDWRAEIDEFRRLVRDVDRNNGLVPPSAFVLDSASIIGARVPCLDADRVELDAALVSTGFRYDASRPGERGEWPKREHGLWSFPIPLIRLPDAPHPLLATDYNLYAHYQWTSTPLDAKRAKLIERASYDSLMAAFDESYHGSRAPFAVSSHFERWDLEAYEKAIAHFLRDACAKPEVRCESFAAVTDWLEARPDGDLARLRKGDFAHLPRTRSAK
jgi:hypothetical protein